jgi:hypothetical protein
MSAKPASVAPSEPCAVTAAFDNAQPLEEPISEEEARAIDEARAAAEPAYTTEELLARLRPPA